MEPSQTMKAILSANQDYLAGRPGRVELDSPCLIAACMSLKLSRHLPAALGLGVEQCYFVRNPGPTITAYDNSILRGAAIAVATGEAGLIVVLGHLQCRAAMDAAEFIGDLEAVGVHRAWLHSDLRGWFGLVGPVEANVRSIVDAIAREPALPRGVAVLGMIMDDRDGRAGRVCEAVTAGSMSAPSATASAASGLADAAATAAAQPAAEAPAGASQAAPSHPKASSDSWSPKPAADAHASHAAPAQPAAKRAQVVPARSVGKPPVKMAASTHQPPPLPRSRLDELADAANRSKRK